MTSRRSKFLTRLPPANSLIKVVVRHPTHSMIKLCLTTQLAHRPSTYQTKSCCALSLPTKAFTLAAWKSTLMVAWSVLTKRLSTSKKVS